MIFIDTEFTDLLNLELLSIGLVCELGEELYLEIDLDGETGRGLVARSSEFVRYEGVLSQWGRIPDGAVTTMKDLANRVCDWLQRKAADGQLLQIAFDYSVDFWLLKDLLADCDRGDEIIALLQPINIQNEVGTIYGHDAAEFSYRTSLQQQGLRRHHALADARALRDAYVTRRSALGKA